VTATTLHKCETNKNIDPADFKGTYLEALKKREDLLEESCKCPPIPSAEEVKRVAGKRKKRRSDDDDDFNNQDDIADDDKLIEVANPNARLSKYINYTYTFFLLAFNLIEK